MVELLDNTDDLQAENVRLKEDLGWYKMWHSKLKQQNEDLLTELETFRPTKLSGHGQCKCSKCGCISWTDWCSRYKGQTLCSECLDDVLLKEQEINNV